MTNATPMDVMYKHADLATACDAWIGQTSELNLTVRAEESSRFVCQVAQQPKPAIARMEAMGWTAAAIGFVAGALLALLVVGIWRDFNNTQQRRRQAAAP